MAYVATHIHIHVISRTACHQRRSRSQLLCLCPPRPAAVGQRRPDSRRREADAARDAEQNSGALGDASILAEPEPVGGFSDAYAERGANSCSARRVFGVCTARRRPHALGQSHEPPSSAGSGPGALSLDNSDAISAASVRLLDFTLITRPHSLAYLELIELRQMLDSIKLVNSLTFINMSSMSNPLENIEEFTA